MIENKPMASPAPIAVIGVGCRFPGGVNSLDEVSNVFLTNLSFFATLSQKPPSVGRQPNF